VKTWITSDHHFSHQKLVEVRGFKSVDEMNEAMIKAWNDTVSPKDKIYHLGDFCLGGQDKIHIAQRLNGNKALILGNHDYPNAWDEYRKYFKVLPYHEVDGCLLSHYPVHKVQQYRYRKNIHGHIHTGKIDDPWYVNVCVEQNNYKPFNLLEVIQ